MKKRSIFLKPLALLFAVIATTMTACGQSKQNDTSNNPKNMETTKIKLTVTGGRTFTATLADNSSAEALTTNHNVGRRHHPVPGQIPRDLL